MAVPGTKACLHGRNVILNVECIGRNGGRLGCVAAASREVARELVALRNGSTRAVLASYKPRKYAVDPAALTIPRFAVSYFDCENEGVRVQGSLNFSS